MFRDLSKKKGRPCRAWPRCACIMQGREDVHCPTEYTVDGQKIVVTQTRTGSSK